MGFIISRINQFHLLASVSPSFISTPLASILPFLSLLLEFISFHGKHLIGAFSLVKGHDVEEAKLKTKLTTDIQSFNETQPENMQFWAENSFSNASNR